MKRAMWNEKQISVDINNGGVLTMFQDKHDGDIVLQSSHGQESVITAADFVMLMNLYHNIKDAKYTDKIDVYDYIAKSA